MDFQAILSNHWGKLLAAVIVVIFGLQYNGVVGKDNDSKGGWATVGSQYQRQAELLPNLVESVKGYAKHESGVLGTVTEMRSKVGQTNIDVSKLVGNPELQQKLTQSAGDMASTLSRLIATRETYPDLKADRQFSKLMDDLSGSANRIAVARNTAIQFDRNYNTAIGKLPFGPVIQLTGFKAKSYYEAPAGSMTVPSVKF
jgi:LemA protein